MTRRDGFTLIEIAVVIVVIALVAGGVLVGRELIRASQIRNQVSQIAEFDAAVNSFRVKYGCLPGDCKNATQLGFGRVTADWGYNIDGNGNGAVSCSQTPRSGCGGFWLDDVGENYHFWYHLYQAKLIPAYECVTGTCSGLAGTLGVMTPRPRMAYQVATAAYWGNYHPGGIGLAWTPNYAPNEGGVTVGSAHFYAFAQTISQGGGSGGGFRPSDLSSLDGKMDDGLPASGRVKSYYAAALSKKLGNESDAWTAPSLCTDNADRPSIQSGLRPTVYRQNDNFEWPAFLIEAGF